MHFELELKTLLNTVDNDELRSFYSNEMERFAALFGRFLQEEGPSVEWDKIQKLPVDAVKDYATLSAPKDENMVSHRKLIMPFVKTFTNSSEQRHISILS